MSFFVPKLYAAPYSSLDTLMNDQMNFFDIELQGGTKLMVQSYVPGVPTTFRQEFSLKLSKFRNGEKSCESLFTF